MWNISQTETETESGTETGTDPGLNLVESDLTLRLVLSRTTKPARSSNRLCDYPQGKLV
jgi:hypothetical protein